MSKANKITAIILTFVLSLSVYLPSYAAQTDNGIQFKRVQDTLNGLGILRFEITDKDAEITRGQFVDMAVHAYFEQLTASGENENFNDILPTYPYRDSLETAYGGGLIKGYGDGNFGAEDTVTLKEALTIIFRMLNYEEYISWLGSFDSQYINVASKIGLLDGVSSSDGALSFKDAVTLMYNAVQTPALELDGIKNGSVGYSKDKNATLISERLGIYKEHGMLTDNHHASLSGTVKAGEGNVIIDGYEYKSGKTFAADFIGRNVTFYYKSINGEAVPTLLYIEDDGSSITEIDAKEYGGYSDGKINYYKNQKSQSSVSVGKSAIVIYNGALVRSADYDDSVFDIDIGSITVIRNSFEGHTVVVIKSYYDMVFERLAEFEDEYVLIDKFDSSKNVEIKNEEDFDIRLADGSAFDIKEAESGTVLSVALSNDKSIGYIIANSEIITQAYVTKTSGDKATFKVYSPDIHTYTETEYEYCKSFKEKNKKENTVKAGSEYTLYIDAFGNVAYADEEKDISDFYAYIIADNYNDKGLSGEYRLKVMHDDGRVIIHTLAKTVKINGKTYKNTDTAEIRAALNLASSRQSGIAYISLNYSSEISVIDMCLEETDEREANYSLYKTQREADNTLYKVGGKKRARTPSIEGTLYYNSNARMFDTGIFVTNSTKVLAVPLDSDDDSRYYSISANMFRNDRYYNVKGYSRSDDSIAAEVLIYYYYSRYSSDPADAVTSGNLAYAPLPFGRSYDNECGFVSAISRGVSDDGNTGYILTVKNVRTSSDVKYFTDDENLIAGIEEGDIVRFFDMAGELCYIEKLYDFEAKSFNADIRPIVWQGANVRIPSYFITDNGDVLSDSYSAAVDADPAFGITHGVIINSDVMHVNFVTYSDYLAGNVDEQYCRTLPHSQAAVYKYDSRANEIEKIKFDEVVSYKDNPGINNEAVIVYITSTIVAIILY